MDWYRFTEAVPQLEGGEGTKLEAVIVHQYMRKTILHNNSGNFAVPLCPTTNTTVAVAVKTIPFDKSLK